MKRLFVILLCLTLAGCVSTGTRGSRLWPWNWRASDSTAKLQKQQTKSDQADSTLRKNAQEFTEAERAAIAAEKARQLKETGTTSREIDTASEYADRAANSLAQTEGPLPAARIRELEQMVADRNSTIAQERSRGDKAIGALDKLAGVAAEAKVRAQKEINALHVRIGEEQQRALVAEEKWNRMKFIGWSILIGGLVIWLGGQVLTRLAETNPVFGPVAAGFNMLAAPALKASWNKVSDMTRRVGEFMADVRKQVPAAAGQVELLLDGVMDAHHKEAIAAAATAAGGGPK